MEIITLVASIVAVIMGTMGLFISMAALSILVGFKNSTHRIEYVPIDSAIAEPDITEMSDDEADKFLDKQKKKRRVQEPTLEDIYAHNE